MKATFDANRMKAAANVMKRSDTGHCGVFEMMFTDSGLELLCNDGFTFSFDIPGDCDSCDNDGHVYAIPIDGFYTIASMWNGDEASVEIDGDFAVFRCCGIDRKIAVKRRMQSYCFIHSCNNEFNVDWGMMYSKMKHVGSVCYDEKIKYYDSGRSYLASVFVSFRKDDMRQHECIVTDGRRLHMTGYVGKNDERIDIAIPYTKKANGILELQRIVSDKALKMMTASIEHDEDWGVYKLCLYSEELGMYTEFSLRNKTIPNFRSVIPKEFSSEIEIGDEISSLVSSIAKRKYSGDEFVSLSLHGGVAKCNAMRGSETSAEASGKGLGEIEKIMFDPKRLHEAILCAGEFARIMINRFDSAAGIKGRGGFCLLMPMRR